VTGGPAGRGCPCCSGEGRVSSDNRPALSHFNYRIGTYGSIREWLLHRINATPVLQNWTHRAPDDPAIALLEGASVLGDILTFYQDTYANEAFLRTAKWRESIADLVRLLGYRLSPAVGGRATFAFELKKDEPVTVPAGFPVKATLEELEKPADFETTEEITAYPWLNRFNLYKPLTQPDIGFFTTEFYISYPNQLKDEIELKPGERLMIGEPPATFFWPGPDRLTNPEIVIIDSVRELHGRKYYKIKGGLKRTANIANLAAYRIGRTFHHFGYNSPAKIVNTTAPVNSTATVTPGSGGSSTTSTSSTIPYLNVTMTRPVKATFSGTGVSMSFGPGDYPIDSDVSDLPVGTQIIIQSTYTYPVTAYIIGEPLPLQTAIRTITDIRTITATWGGVSGTVSMLRFGSGGGLGSTVGQEATMQIADALFHETTSPLFSIRAAHSETSSATGNRLNFYGTQAQAEDLENRRIMLEKPGEEPKIVTVQEVNPAPPFVPDAGTEDIPQLYPLLLSETVDYADFSNNEPQVTVFGNLADADEGLTQAEIAVGSGDALQPFQNFKLPKAPLTYHLVPENTPPETPELAIYVDGREWAQVDSFFGHGGDEQIYIVREDADGNSWVQFGDGKSGARLPNGSNNVTAVYRTGAGAYGPLKPDTNVLASAKLKNLDKIGMPMESTGGAQAEDGDSARTAAPGKVQSLGRLVSLSDFEYEAAAIGGVVLASASWQLRSNIPTIVVAILMETGRDTEADEVGETLNAYNRLRGAARDPVTVEPGRRKYVTATVQYALKAGYRADLVEPAIRLALGVNHALAERDEDQTGLFSVRRRRFGGAEYASSIEGTVQNVDGVLWAKTIVFQEVTGDDPETAALPATSVRRTSVDAAAGEILSLYDKHLFLTSAPGEAG
jgi:hypothetical protein